MKLSEAKHTIDYMVSWPLAAPGDAYRAGKEYHLIVGIVVSLLGIPWIPARFLVGTGAATYNYATSN